MVSKLNVNLGNIENFRCAKRHPLLKWAVLSNELDLAHTLLGRFPNLVDVGDAQGDFPIHWASAIGDVLLVHKIIQLGGSIECSGGQGLRPVHFASMHNFPLLVSYFKINGAKLDSVDVNERTPLH